jgi:hypothetical protein
MIAIMMCDDCDAQMEEVFKAQDDFRLKGWVCTSCLNFTPAIGRERLFTQNDKTEDDSRPR